LQGTLAPADAVDTLDVGPPDVPKQ
jgi:hypothetical protein